MTLEDDCNNEEQPKGEQTNCPYLAECCIAYHHKGCFENDFSGCTVYKFFVKFGDKYELITKHDDGKDL